LSELGASSATASLSAQPPARKPSALKQTTPPVKGDAPEIDTAAVVTKSTEAFAAPLQHVKPPSEPQAIVNEPKVDAARNLPAPVKRAAPEGSLPEQVAFYRGELRRCYEYSIRGQDVSESTQLNIRFTVGTDGYVSNVATLRSKASPSLNRCLKQSVKGWRFSPQPTAVSLQLPVNFVPQG